MSVVVKICGVRTMEAALVAAAAGADLIGLIFAASRRQVTLAQAATIVRGLRGDPAGQGVLVTGVFVNTPPEQIEAIARSVPLDWIQLSGHEDAITARGLSRPVLKTIRFDGHNSEHGWLDTDRCDADPIHIDAHVAGSFGGAGVTADWERAARIARGRPVLLAGGLNLNNVAEAIAVVGPWGVDVSSGIETAGLQDHAKIEAFIRTAKGAGRKSPVQGRG